MAQITGTSSADVLVGTSGSDVFTGRDGNDVFVYSANGQVDVITDFGSIYFSGPITGAQEAPPNNSTASGQLAAVLNRAQTTFDYAATLVGLDLGGQTAATTDNVTAAHFHRAPVGVSGGVVFGFIGTPFNETQGEIFVNPVAGTLFGQWDANEGNGTNTLTSLIPALLNNEIYINFHTSVFPAGEIRGQAIARDTGQDRIDLSGVGIPDFATLQMFMTQVGGSTQITTTWNSQANTLVLQGVPLTRVAASDFIFAGATGRTQFGTAGNDDIFGGGGTDLLFGEAGNDRIWAGAGADSVEGRDGNDTVVAGDGNDIVSGGLGNDDVNGNAGADIVHGDGGADTVRGGQGDDTVWGDAGDDPHVNGNMGNDVVHGGDGNDTVYGGRDNDTLFGEAGADWLSGDLGNDILFGGAGADRFLFRPGAGLDWVGDFNFAEGDRIQLAVGTTFTLRAHLGQALVTLSSGENLGLAGVAAASATSEWVVFV